MLLIIGDTLVSVETALESATPFGLVTTYGIQFPAGMRGLPLVSRGRLQVMVPAEFEVIVQFCPPNVILIELVPGKLVHELNTTIPVARFIE